MLGFEDSAKLLKVLNGGGDRNLEEIVSEFNTKFPRSMHFAACSAIEFLLEDPMDKLLNPTQRLIGFTILHQAYASQQPSSNPFISKLVDFFRQSAADYVKKFNLPFQSFPQCQHLQQQYCTKIQPEQFKCLFKDNSLKNVIPDPDVPQGCDSNSVEFDSPGVASKIGSGNRDETIARSLSCLSLEGLTPQWVRPFPPRLPVMDEELYWLNPDFKHELLWDHGMCADTSRGAAVRDLIAKALKGALVPAQQEVPFICRSLDDTSMLL